MELKWYIVHTYSGFENRVKETLQEKIKSFGKEIERAYRGAGYRMIRPEIHAKREKEAE